MYTSIIFLPLFGFLNLALFGIFLGRKGSCYLVSLYMFITMCFSFFFFFDFLSYGFICKVKYFSWIDISTIIINWEFLYDSVTFIMLLVVLSVSFVVHIYSIGYMANDPFLIRFMSYLSLFTFFMLMLITGNNLLHLFLGWEGVGICSYLLISFWFTRLEALKSSLKAIIVNKIGDFFLFVSIIFSYFFFNTINYGILFNIIELFKYSYIVIFNCKIHLISLICIFFMIGVIGKSAQIGLHIWLPDAMEGPTPVSALIHAATMVTAGVFLVIRLSSLFEYSVITLIFLVIFGSFTAFMGATIALFQVDIKKIIAYSTCSQLGYMVLSCGLSGYNVALYHLFNHAFFKALLFLTAGIIIHSVFDEQDLRKISGNSKFIVKQTAFWFLSIGTLAIIGFPGFSGFFSKDKILELAYSSNSYIGFFGFFWGLVTVFLTAFYSYKLLYLVFFNMSSSLKTLVQINMKKVYLHNDFIMFIPLYLLIFGSVFSGYFFEYIFTGFGSLFFEKSIINIRYLIYLQNMEYISSYIKMLTSFILFFGIFFSYLILSLICKSYLNFIYNCRFYYNLIIFFLKKWNFDKLYNEYVVVKVYNVSFTYALKYIEKGIIEYYVIKDLILFFSFLSGRFSKFFHHGNLYLYALYFNLLFWNFILLNYVFDNYFYYFFLDFYLYFYSYFYFMVLPVIDIDMVLLVFTIFSEYFIFIYDYFIFPAAYFIWLYG